MKKYLLSMLLVSIFLACSPDEKVNPNAVPSGFALEELTFTGPRVSLSWTTPTDADNDRIYYNVYIDSKLIEGPIARNNLSTILEYNKNYTGVIIATDRKGGTSQITFNFRSPTSMVAFVSEFNTGNLLAIDLHTQKTLWTTPSGDRVHSINDGLVFTGFDQISAFKILTGEKVWAANPVERAYDIGYWHLMADERFLFAKSLDGLMVSIDLQRREKQWEISLFESIFMYAMDRDNLYIPKRNNEDLISVNKITGETQWGFMLDPSFTGAHNRIEHAPLIYGGNLYFLDGNNLFYSVNKTTGEKNYSVFVGKASETAPIAVNGNIIFSARDEIISLKAENGQMNWKYNFGAYSGSSPFEENGRVYVGAGNDLFCFEADTGTLIWQTNLGGELMSSPVVYDKTVYISSSLATLNGVDAITGNLKWKTANVTYNTSSPTIVIGETDEVIYPSNAGFHN
ncbi:MAG TPA: PQQ-binding-like beta-propeller repeat protein [Gillisia sp.]|nr:PQQ-binding-like beta-propeller repeat protein [Gillisia sp.]